nr:YbaK/EbsC family protein [Sansalvadorimonas sp. 2012CJ34-2]
MQSAIASNIQSSQVAKAVVVHDPLENYLMAVIPAGRRLHLRVLEDLVDKPLKLATEEDLANRFPDCETGAIPPMGPAFNMEMIWDDQLLSCQDIFLEAGDHTTLVHVSGEGFQTLAADAMHDRISQPVRNDF